MSPENHAVGSGNNPQDVPSTQEGGNTITVHVSSILAFVTFRVQVDIISRGEIQNCRVEANLPSSCADTSTTCQDPEPSPIALPNAPRISFEFTRNDNIDPENATDQRRVDTLCFADGTWKTPLDSLTFRYIKKIVPGGNDSNPFSANVKAAYTIPDGNSFLSNTLFMPPFPNHSDDNTIPVFLSIDLDSSEVTAVAE